MTRKPTYQELERRVKELEREAVMRKQAEEMPRESEERLSTFVDSSTDFFSIWDSELDLIEINKLE
jgi:PAS domain-containing protein